MKTNSKLHPQTSGYKEPSWDYFMDVKVALNNWLMRKDQTYQKASALAKERHQRIKERRMA